MIFNKITLSLPEKSERMFLKQYFSDSIVQVRIAFLLTSLLYASFGYLDVLMVPNYVKLFHAIRFYFVVPLLLAVLLLSFTSIFRKIWQGLLFVCYIFAGMGITIMNVAVPENYAYSAGMMLVFSAGYFFIKLRFFLATIAGWLTLLIFNIGTLMFTEASVLLLVNNNFFFVSANLIGMLGAYNIEYYARRDFYLNQELDKQKEFVEDINKNLEKIVGERTVELTEAKNKAVQSDHLKSAFLANMSHEIRTPMNGILGFADLLKEPNLTGKEQQQYIGIIEKSGARMLNIINDIVDISKIEAGLVEVVLTESKINEQIDFIQTFFKPMAEAKKVHLSSKTSLPAMESIILTDKEKVYGILTNLVKNAIKFTDSGFIEFGYELVKTRGELVETRHALSLQEPYLRFYVKDTGIGIAADHQKAIFERFIQADIHDVNARQGAGLGLTIAKAYTEMLGGEIWMESEMGQGSTFYFTLPYNRASQQQGATAAWYNLPHRGANQKSIAPSINILIAEDDETSAAYLAALVAGNNRTILRVRTGKEAVNACKNETCIDLILMDIKMADMDGYEATRLIRAFNSDVIIIAQTAYALAGDKEKAFEAGCNDYIEKPIQKDRLLKLIQKYFNQP